MKYSKLKASFVLTIAVLFSVGLALEGQVKADTMKTQQANIIKSATLSTENVIKIPDKTVFVVKSSNVNISRGGNITEFDGVKGSDNGIVAFAYTLIGKPYVWGAVGPNSFDCSGLAMYVYAHFGIYLPHYTGSQFQVGQAVAKKDLQPGDLVFFNTYSSISHVGIYIGGGNFIQAPSTGSRVTISNLGDGYYQSAYAGARRYIK